MIPIITRHYGYGLVVGIGFGLFLAKILFESGIVTDQGGRNLMGLAGMLGMMVGGTLYAMSLRKAQSGN